MIKFEEKEIKKLRPIENTWYNWLINYIPEPIVSYIKLIIYRVQVVLKIKLLAFSRQTHLNKQCMEEERN